MRKSYNMVRFRVTDVQGRSSSSKLVRIKSSFRFPRVFHCSYMLNFYCFRDIKNYWSKICIFSPFLCTTRKWCKVCCCLVLCNWRINRCFRIKKLLRIKQLYIHSLYTEYAVHTSIIVCIMYRPVCKLAETNRIEDDVATTAERREATTSSSSLSNHVTLAT